MKVYKKTSIVWTLLFIVTLIIDLKMFDWQHVTWAFRDAILLASIVTFIGTAGLIAFKPIKDHQKRKKS